MHVPSAATPVELAEPDGHVETPTPSSVRPTRALARRLSGSPWGRSAIAGLTSWSIGYLALGAITLFGQEPKPSFNQTIGPWIDYDAEVLRLISEHGYHQVAPAFFPLFPLLVRGAGAVLPGGPGTAFLITSMTLLAALAVLHRLVEREFDEGTARRTAWYLLAFPTGFFLLIPYNHALSLLLAVSFFYLLRGQRWWAAALVAGLATATRSSAILLVLPFCYEYLRLHGRRIRPSALAVLIMPSGLVAFAAYTWWALGDPLAFVHAQRIWGRAAHWPWDSVSKAVAVVARHSDHAMLNLLDLGVLAAFVVLLTLAFVGPWRMRPDQYALPIYGVALIGFLVAFPTYLPFYNEPFLSLSRLVLDGFPAFAVLARAGRNPVIDRGYLFPALVIQGILAAHFLNHGWVA